MATEQALIRGTDELTDIAALAQPIDGNLSSPTIENAAWSKRSSLPSDTPPVPLLPEWLLPPPLLPWLADVAERVAIPLEFVAIPAIVGLGAVVGRSIGVRPKRRDDWTVTPNLWGGLVGRPGVLKSAGVDEGIHPLRRLADEARTEHETGSAEALAKVATIEMKISATRESMKKVAKEGGDLDALTRELVVFDGELQAATVHERRYITQDTTVEKLGELLRQNPRGMLVMRDELSGFMRTLDKSGREGDREFYLEAWNGTGAYTSDRIGRGTVHIPAVTVSILGTVQPGKLQAYIDGALSGAAQDDGLLQRFQLLVWPDVLGEWRNVDRWPDADARRRAVEIYRDLDRLSPSLLGAESDGGSIPSLRFCPGGQDLFDAWRDGLEARLRSDEFSKTPAFESHLAKYRSLMPGLALLFHLTDIVAGTSVGSGSAITLEAARRGAEWCDYLEPHARKIYAAEVDSDVLGARALAQKIEDGDVGDGAALRDIYRPGWSALTSTDEVHAAANVLERLHWCRIEDEATGGRPSKVLRIHPDLRFER